jgi:hypothetical protein
MHCSIQSWTCSDISAASMCLTEVLVDVDLFRNRELFRGFLGLCASLLALRAPLLCLEVSDQLDQMLVLSGQLCDLVF